MVQVRGDPFFQPAPNRPANAPPTYEDAMKFVNDAFQINDEEEVLGLEEGDGVEDVLPPSYSETPRAGEQVLMIFSLDTLSLTLFYTRGLDIVGLHLIVHHTLRFSLCLQGLIW
jgi:hypothetical protein